MPKVQSSSGSQFINPVQVQNRHLPQVLSAPRAVGRFSYAAAPSARDAARLPFCERAPASIWVSIADVPNGPMCHAPLAVTAGPLETTVPHLGLVAVYTVAGG